MKKLSATFSCILILILLGVYTGFTFDSATSKKGSGDALPVPFQLFSENVSIHRDGDYIVLETDNIPNHSSPYFSKNNAKHEAYNGSNARFHLNPNRIREQQLTFRIPVNPAKDDRHLRTRLGPIGVALNGVVLFNQFAGPGRSLSFEINSFDQYNGHPQQHGVYHYHVEPLYLTAINGKESLIGFLLDGFPVYGPRESGKLVKSEDLDKYHGHFSETAEYPDGIYHYHITSDDPYINGGKYFGTPGRVTH